MTTKRVSLEQLPGVLEVDGTRALGVLAVRLPAEWAREFSVRAPRITPVGTLGVTSPHPGKLRASLKFSTGPQPAYANLPDRTWYPIPGPVDLHGLKPGESVWATYDARTGRSDSSYAAAIEAGHSPQRPTGWVRDTIEELGRMAPELERRAVLAAEESVR